MTAKKILVVDDDCDLHESLKTFLESEGFEVSSAFDGDEAQDMVMRWHADGVSLPDYLLVDLMMPKMTGQELLTQLQSAQVLGNTRVVILSAASEPKELLPQIPLSFLAKPFDLGDLLGVLA